VIATIFVALVALSPDVARIQIHLAEVEAELRTVDTSELSADQRARREAVIDELARYRTRGAFPRNLDFAERTPYFIDDRGVRCAMAHLIEMFGGAPLVERVARTANNAYVRELADDAELAAWLSAHGITLAEAARIQPTYERLGLGERCDSGFECTFGLCIPSFEDPGFSYCSVECAGTLEPCPHDARGNVMVCWPVVGRHACMYPIPTPGAAGSPCTAGCTCVIDDHGAYCTHACEFDEDCPEDLTCTAEPEGARSCRLDGTRTDHPGPPGCASTDASLALVVVPLLALRRRSRPSRTAPPRE
jgi:hypothetical protein